MKVSLLRRRVGARELFFWSTEQSMRAERKGAQG